MSVDQDLRAGPGARWQDAVADAALVTALESVDPADLVGEELAAYVHASWRVQNRATARLLDGLHRLGRAEAGRATRRAGLDEFSGDEVAALLGWSRTMSGRKLDLADDLQDRLPEVGDALHDGWIDEPKARTICDWTRDLADDHAHHVCQIVLPEAPQLPVGALIERIETVATALDPDWAERRRKRAEARAQVILTPNPSGTATLSFRDAPTPDGIASQARIDALAAAVRHLGVLTPIGQLRLQVGMRLLDGSTAGMDDRIIAVLLATEYHQQNAPDDADGGPNDSDPDPDPDDGPPDGPPDGPDDGPGPPDRDGPDGSGAPPDPTGEPDLPDEPGDPEPAEPPVAADVPERRPGTIRTGTVEIRLRLTTALGLDQHPATVPGYGGVLAHNARTMIMQRRDAEWRVVLTGPDGRLQHVLLARRRPRPPSPHARWTRTRGRSAAIVELQVPTTLLAALTPGDHGDWAPLLVELQHRLVELGGIPVRARPPDHNADPDDRARRRPGAELDRWIRVRDRHCVAPSCRSPAHRAELDHTRSHASGGPTSSWNLGVWCTHHHRAKHHAGWHVRQTSPGRFLIRTRAGADYTATPKRVTEPLPAPRPADRPRPLPYDGRPDPADDLDPDWMQQVAPKLAKLIHPDPTAPPPVPRAGNDDDAPPF